MKALLDLAEDLSLVNEKTSALVVAVDGVASAESDAEKNDESSASDTDISESESPVDSEEAKRAAQRAAFTKHLEGQQRQEEREPSSTSTKKTSHLNQGSEAESSRIIDKVRDYQQEMFERAKAENIIAVLDTGSGEPPKIVCFLANSVHLVQQQAKVLTNNLIESPAVLYGGNNKANLWLKKTWEDIKQHNKIVVCTPAVLDQALAHSYISMEDISLLVFDEVHHTKKDHPYSRLIRSYYLKCIPASRPRIFGMTASAVDTKKDVAQTAEALEELLHAKIVTTDDTSLMSFAPKPEDVKWTYPRLRPHFDTDLHQELRIKVSFCQDLKRGFEFAKKATTELGPWCADRAWQYIMGTSPNQSSSTRRKFEQSAAYASIDTVKDREDALEALDQAAIRVQEHSSEVPELVPAHLSSKVILLHDKLAEQFREKPETRAIVFVEERLKALVLNECFKLLKIPKVTSGTLLGIAGSAFEAATVKGQEKSLEQFRAGIINLMFATSVADEGLDIPQCNLCVRFDLCKTTIQYMQSRGRARMHGSIFAHMIEDGVLDQSHELDYQINNEQYIKRWCSSLAPERKLGHGTQLAKLLAKDEGGKSFKTGAGAVCDNSNALLILARFAASLAYTGATEREIYTEEIDSEKNLFRYAVRLPANSECPVPGCRGDWKTNKQLAKRSAAWATCYLLRRKGHLDDNLDSIYRKIKPENANARLAVSSKRSAYDMQIKPSVWQAHLDVVPTQLHATVIRFRPDRPLKHKLAPIVVLTTVGLPLMPSFPAYLEDNVKIEVSSEAITTVLAVSEDELKSLTAFTLDGVFSDVFNKVYAHEPEKLSYWLAPMVRLRMSNIRSLSDIVDVDAINAVRNDRLQWEPGMSPDRWANKFLCDPLNGKFHYFTKDVVPEAKVTDPVPEYVPHIQQKKRRNIIDFSDSTWTKSKKKVPPSEMYDLEQPVFAADLVGTKRNFLDSAVREDLIPCLIAPQKLQVARLDTEFARSCLVWPALIHRIESYMITMEAFDKLGLKGVPAELALEAFTKDADNEEEEVQTHTGGKRGMGKNYERLEFIGDSLLKMTTTMTVYNRTKCDEEGMHCRRMELLCNRNLFNVATSNELQLFRYARTLGFDRTTWYPEQLKLISGRGAKKDPQPGVHEPISQDLGMKTIADMSEAIIGAATTSTRHLPPNNNRFDLGIQAITKLVRSEDHAVMSWADIASQYTPEAWSLQANDPIANDRARIVAAKTGYHFKHPRLLRSAFTHSSDMNSPVPDLQRLEFLGDAVLDWVCISWLFYTYPTRNPQWLTEHKMAMVSNKFLAALAVTLDFDKFVFLTTAKLVGDIQTYATKVREARSQPDCPDNFWMDIDSPPKALSDLIESYLGAVLVDSGFDYAEMERFFENHVKQFFRNISDYDTFANRHPTTYLYNKLGQEYKCRDHIVKDSQNPANDGAVEVEILAAVIIHGEIVADARSTGARYARVRASKKALSLLEGLSREEFRKKFRCNCAIKDE
ncbi:Dicer-like protein 1 [Knufia fluminis]|uniref:Dicer-like protein 1 n=1 Tax=Knufia fluminis TaxID=191047 RepID=A0AAN8EJ11_9EURO|nr:Dicer-like protein 1 [Knufia fluminis]